MVEFSNEEIEHYLTHIFGCGAHGDLFCETRENSFSVVNSAQNGGVGSRIEVFQVREDDGMLVLHKFICEGDDRWYWMMCGAETHPIYHYGIITDTETTFTTEELIDHIDSIPAIFSD
jgi:hypothetical protein